MALKVKANHYPLLDSKFKFSQLEIGSHREIITLPSKVSSLQLGKLRRKINVSKEERCLGFIKKTCNTRMHSSRMRTTPSLTISRGVSVQGMPAQGGCLPRGVFALGGVCLGGGACPCGCLPRGVPRDLSHHAFDVTCMLSCHQLRLITSAAVYIVFGHVTCGACLDTTTPVDRMTNTCKNITFANFICGQ